MTITCESNQAFRTSPPIRWEWVPCNLCGRDDPEQFHQERLNYFNTVLDFQIVRCRHCGLVYTNPRLSDHNATYLWGSCDDPDTIEQHGRVKGPVFDKALNRIELLVHRTDNALGNMPPRLLDIGCGSGHFLAAARHRGFEVCGIEPARIPADYAEGTFHLPVIRHTILDTELPEEQFDVITAWDVIEHVSDPRAVMSRCVRWLKPNGIMALRFPSAHWQKFKGLILHRLLASERAVFAPTMHLYFFTAHTFARMCRPLGLKVERIQTTPAEKNTNHFLLDRIKVMTGALLRSLDSLCQSPLGNLEVFCRRKAIDASRRESGVFSS